MPRKPLHNDLPGYDAEIGIDLTCEEIDALDKLAARRPINPNGHIRPVSYAAPLAETNAPFAGWDLRKMLGNSVIGLAIFCLYGWVCGLSQATAGNEPSELHLIWIVGLGLLGRWITTKGGTQ